jgi:cytidylate kinase
MPAVVVGRDIGTVVFPSAVLKVFLDVDLTTRVARRAAQRNSCDIACIQESIQARDVADRDRRLAPLRAATDAIAVDAGNGDLVGLVRFLASLYRLRSSQLTSTQLTSAP